MTTFTNRFQLRRDDFHTRITFTEVVDETVTPICSIVMLNSDAKLLEECLSKLAAKAEATKGTKQ